MSACGGSPPPRPATQGGAGGRGTSPGKPTRPRCQRRGEGARGVAEKSLSSCDFQQFLSVQLPRGHGAGPRCVFLLSSRRRRDRAEENMAAALSLTQALAPIAARGRLSRGRRGSALIRAAKRTQEDSEVTYGSGWFDATRKFGKVKSGRSAIGAPSETPRGNNPNSHHVSHTPLMFPPAPLPPADEYREANRRVRDPGSPADHPLRGGPFPCANDGRRGPALHPPSPPRTPHPNPPRRTTGKSARTCTAITGTVLSTRGAG